jgi:hypothetical protein
MQAEQAKAENDREDKKLQQDGQDKIRKANLELVKMSTQENGKN